jgi:hypothetical protein
MIGLFVFILIAATLTSVAIDLDWFSRFWKWFMHGM